MERILFINGHLGVGGVERSLTDILRHIDYSTCSVDLLLLEGTGSYADELPPDVRVILRDIHDTYGSFFSAVRRCIAARNGRCLLLRALLLLRRFFGPRALRPAARILLGQHRYDTVIGFRPGICSELAAFSVRAERRFVWWHHGDLSGIDRRTYAAVCRRANSVVAVSQGCRRLLAEAMPQIADRITVIPNMLDAEVICRKAQGRMVYAPGGWHIVSVGRLVPEKHFDDILPAAEALLAAGHRFVWHIVGDGPERERLHGLICRHGLQGRVILEGSKADPYPYIRCADLLVHPSHVESQGLTVLEALALGVPCVVVRSVGPCEFLTDGVDALLADRTPQALTAAVLRIVGDRALYRQIRQNSRCPSQFAPDRVMAMIGRLTEGPHTGGAAQGR